MNVILAHRQWPLVRKSMIVIPLMTLAVTLLGSCQKKTSALTASDKVEAVPCAIVSDLPLAKYSSQQPDFIFRDIGNHAILATIHEGGYQIDEHPHTRDLNQLEKLIRQRRQSLLSSGHPYLLIAAAPQTPFAKIRELIRSAAGSGLDNICFAVKRSTGAANNSRHKLHILLPAACGCGPPLVRPLFIKTNHRGDISLQGAQGKELMDTDPAMRNLPLLEERLSQFAALTQAAGQEPQIRIYVHRETTYQRVIDILSALEQFHICNIIFTDFVGENEQPVPRPNQPLPRNPYLSL